MHQMRLKFSFLIFVFKLFKDVSNLKGGCSRKFVPVEIFYVFLEEFACDDQFDSTDGRPCPDLRDSMACVCVSCKLFL